MSASNPPPPELSADAERHLQKARENYALFQELLADGTLDWAVTVLFYSAPQLVDAWFVEYGFGVPRDHQERRLWVRQHLRFLWDRGRTPYRDLEDASRDARYNLREFTPEQVQRLHDREFGHIEAQMRNRGVGL